jgi:dsRNA-specific ribonuclease
MDMDANSITNLSDGLQAWLSTSPTKVDVAFLTTNNAVLALIEDVLVHENVNRVVISSKMNPEFMAGNPRVFRFSEYGFGQRMYAFLDFNETTSIMGDQLYAYSKRVEWAGMFRKYCSSIMTYKYAGSDITAGYWSISLALPKISAQILSISDWGHLSQRLPVYDGPNVGGLNIYNSETGTHWIESMKTFVAAFLRGILAKSRNLDVEKIIEHYISDKGMIRLVQAFTHETQNAVFNYEGPEHLGDSIFYTHFSSYLHFRFRRITPQEASGFQLRYLSAEFQQYWSEDLNLFDRMIKRDFVKKTSKAKTDILEAFMGAMALIAHDYSPGFDLFICNLIITMICDSLPFDKDMIFGKSKQRVIQINESLGYPSESIKIKEEIAVNGTVLMNVSVSNSLYEFYKSKDSENRNRLVSGGLTKIASIKRNYTPQTTSRADAEDQVWSEIADVYEANDLSLNSARFSNLIFSIVKANDPDTYKRFMATISQEPFNLNESELNRIVFKQSIFEDYVIMYILPAPPGEGYLTNRSMSRYVNHSRLADDYRMPYLGNVQETNLAVIPIPPQGTAATIGRKTVTNVQFATYSCILAFVAEYGSA